MSGNSTVVIIVRAVVCLMVRNSGTPAAYECAATALGIVLCKIRLVAAHGWDIAGALAAGCHAALARRPRVVPRSQCQLEVASPRRCELAPCRAAEVEPK